MIIVEFSSNGGKTVKHDSPNRVILIVKPWNPWLRSFSMIWDVIEERCRGDAELFHLHFDSDPNLPLSREKYDLSMESKDPRSK